MPSDGYCTEFTIFHCRTLYLNMSKFCLVCSSNLARDYQTVSKVKKRSKFETESFNDADLQIIKTSYGLHLIFSLEFEGSKIFINSAHFLWQFSFYYNQGSLYWTIQKRVLYHVGEHLWRSTQKLIVGFLIYQSFNLLKTYSQSWNAELAVMLVAHSKNPQDFQESNDEQKFI